LARPRPNALTLNDGVSVKLDNRTRLLHSCVTSSCSVYVGYRPHTGIAAWIYGVDRSAIYDVGIWQVTTHFVVMADGLRLRSVARSSYTNSDLRSVGTHASVTLDGRGTVRQIDEALCA
jgi:hypothetical protein